MELTIMLTGIVGLSLLLVAFVLSSIGKINQKDRTYNILNFFGALLLAIYAIQLNSLVFVILEIVWGLVALYNLLKR